MKFQRFVGNLLLAAKIEQPPGLAATNCLIPANEWYQTPDSGTVLILRGLTSYIRGSGGAQPEKSVLMNSITDRCDSRSLTLSLDTPSQEPENASLQIWFMERPRRRRAWRELS